MRGVALQPAPGFQRDAREQRAGRVGGQQHAVGDAGIAMAEIDGEARHLRLVGVADEERGQPGEQRHRDQDRLAPMARMVCTMSARPRTREARCRRAPWRGSGAQNSHSSIGR